MKKTTALILSLVLLFSFTSCGSEKEVSAGDYTFTDDLGRTVSVKSTERVATLLGSFADMWLLAGGEVCAAADDAWEDFSLDLDEAVINLGSTHHPDKEGLFISKPTLVFASAKLSSHLEMRESLEGMGIDVAYFDVGDFDSFLRVFEIMTNLTGQRDKFEKHGLAQKQEIESILSSHKTERVQTVLVMRASAANIRAKNSEDTMLGGMLSDFGCVNIADSDSMLLDNLSVESILLKNPDKIFFIETGDDPESIKAAVDSMFRENPLWQELSAVKNGRVYYMDKSLYNLKPNARFAEAYDKLEKILYE